MTNSYKKQSSLRYFWSHETNDSISIESYLCERFPWWSSGSIPGLEDPTCSEPTKLVCHNYGVHVLQLLKPVCPEPVLHKRSHHDEESSPRSPQLKKACVQQQRPTTAKNINLFFLRKLFMWMSRYYAAFRSSDGPMASVRFLWFTS